MTRRELLKTTAAAMLATLLKPVAGFAQPRRRHTITIDELLQTSWQKARDEVRHGWPFSLPELNARLDAGTLQQKALGCCVQRAPLLLASGELVHRMSEVQLLTVPIVWSKQDEEHYRTEKDKIDLVARLIENGVHAHDDLLLDHIQHADEAAVSRHACCELGETISLGDDAYAARIYTIYAVAPSMAGSDEFDPSQGLGRRRPLWIRGCL